MPHDFRRVLGRLPLEESVVDFPQSVSWASTVLLPICHAGIADAPTARDMSIITDGGSL
jgi:hypothetical protein